MGGGRGGAGGELQWAEPLRVGCPPARLVVHSAWRAPVDGSSTAAAAQRLRDRAGMCQEGDSSAAEFPMPVISNLLVCCCVVCVFVCPGAPIVITALPGEPGQAEMITDQGAIYVTNNRAYTWSAAVMETVDATLNRTVSSGKQAGGASVRGAAACVEGRYTG